MKSYGITDRRSGMDKIDLHQENIKIKGFSVEPEFLEPAVCDDFAKRLEEIYQQQETSFGKENLKKINELDIARMPFVADRLFFKLFMNDTVLKLAERVLGKHFHLHLQNGIINRPAKEHHQSSWHRDLPYQDWVISKPLGFNVFYCLNDFTATNGATFFLPYSHRLEYFPSNEFVRENEFQIVAPKGSVIFFDSMLYHRAGFNSTPTTRIGINNMFVVPILKQQIDVPFNFKEMSVSEEEARILGVTFQTPATVNDLRQRKLKKVEGEK